MAGRSKTKTELIEEVEQLRRQLAAREWDSQEAREATTWSLLEALPLGLLLVDADGTLLRANRAAEELWGRPLLAGERLQKHAARPGWWPDAARVVDHPETLPGFGPTPPGARASADIDVLAFDGRHKVLEVTVVPIRGPNDRHLRDLVVHADVTARARSERDQRALTEGVGRVAETLDYDTRLRKVATFVASWLGDYCIVYAPPGDKVHRMGLAARGAERQRLLDRMRSFPPVVRPDSVLGQALTSRRAVLVREVAPAWLWQQLHSTERTEYWNALEALEVHSAMVLSLQVRHRIVGALLICSADPQFRYDEHDLAVAQEFAQLVAYALENSRLHHETQQAVLRAKESVALLDTFLSNSPAGLAVVDRDLRYMRVNDAYTALTGRPAREHIGRSIFEMLPQSLSEVSEPLVRRLLETGEPVVGVERTYESHTEPGKFRHILTSYYPVGRMAGEVFAIGAVVMDITEQKVSAEELRRDAALRELFIGMLGHDLRQPVCSIALTASTLLQQGELTETQDRGLRRIAASARRMTEMIAAILDFTRARSGGGIPIAPAPMDLHAACRQAVEEIEAAHPTRTISLTLRGDGRGEWDAARIAEVFSNLIVNALNYSPPDTPVVVRVDDRGPVVVFSVHNTNAGPPIPPEAAATLFDPFRRGPRGAGPVAPKGLGLGLFIADQIVRAHGGAIVAQSDATAGTTFTVTLPRTPRGTPAPGSERRGG